MENASKALIMAAGVLLGLMILGALVLLFNNLSTYQQTNQQIELESQIVEFNNQFITYDRKDVRGNELYSLLNRVIDYNKRKTLVGNSEASQVGYQPMSIKFSLKSPDVKNQKALTMDGVVRFFQNNKNDYLIDKSNNTFEDYINNKIKELTKGSSNSSDDLTENELNQLATGMTKIFLESNATSNNKKVAENAFKTITGKNISYEDIQNYKERVYAYYEYIQFKRAHFDCIGTNYDSNTGRILYLEFQFNGKIE